MRYRPFFIAAVTALLTFMSLQLTLGSRYDNDHWEWGWRHRSYHHDYPPAGYDDWYYRKYRSWQEEDSARDKSPADSMRSHY